MTDITLGIPVYNSTPFLDELFASLRRLDPTPAEIVFLDDASNDDSTSRIRRFIADLGGRGNVRLVCNESNLGIAGAYNRLVSEASGEWIQLLDADDLIVDADYYERVGPLFRQDVDVVVTGLTSNARFLNAGSRTLARLVPHRPPLWWPLLGSFATRAGVLYRRSVLTTQPFTDPAFPGSDILHLLECCQAKRCAFEARARVFYRVHPNAQSSGKRDYSRYSAELRRFRFAVRLTHKLDLELRRAGQRWMR